MGMTLIDLHQARGPSSDDLPGLNAYLFQLVGEPFRFSRVSYGDELTLHFGDLRPARSPNLQHRLYGAYLLGLRGSRWVLKSGSEPVVIWTGAELAPEALPAGKLLRNQDLEAGAFLQPEIRVVAASPFVVKPANGFGLHLRMSDGSTLLVLPAPPEPEEPGVEELPPLAAWELATPLGLLSVGPGLEWSFIPTKDVPSGRATRPTV